MKTNKDLIIFVLSFGRAKVPTLRLISDKKNVVVLTSTDNEFRDKIKTEGARLMVFDKAMYKGQGLEMMNEETVPHRRSAVYAYNYAIEWGRENGYKYVCVLDDDYKFTQRVNERTEHKKNLMLDKWAWHAVSFLKKYPFIGASCAINLGQMTAGLCSAYFSNLKKRQLMNTCIFNTAHRHFFNSLGNGDYVTQAIMNTYSGSAIVRLQTLVLAMETINDKKHETIDYGNLFYSRWSVVMANPAYTYVMCRRAQGILGKRPNTYMRGNNAPKIVSL